jgi:lipid II:glycine glycyltransferase (peptidoglycan interpeptide bridge formation enzyme)
MRPATATATAPHDFGPAQTFYLHRLDLGPDLDALLRSFHKDSIQRKIRRAERERLTYEEGRSEALLAKLADLLELTRRRHRVPRQPLNWFRNQIDCLGDRVCIRVASKDDRPIAAILTLTFRDTVVYKYGGSDARLHALGGMPFLFSKTIEQAKRNGARELDFGRSDCDNAGLVVFKDRWATTRSTLTYWRTPQRTQAITSSRFALRLGKRAVSWLPPALQRGLATLLYRHIG